MLDHAALNPPRGCRFSRQGCAGNCRITSAALDLRKWCAGSSPTCAGTYDALPSLACTAVCSSAPKVQHHGDQTSRSTGGQPSQKQAFPTCIYTTFGTPEPHSPQPPAQVFANSWSASDTQVHALHSSTNTPAMPVIEPIADAIDKAAQQARNQTRTGTQRARATSGQKHPLEANRVFGSWRGVGFIGRRWSPVLASWVCRRRAGRGLGSCGSCGIRSRCV